MREYFIHLRARIRTRDMKAKFESLTIFWRARSASWPSMAARKLISEIPASMLAMYVDHVFPPRKPRKQEAGKQCACARGGIFEISDYWPITSCLSICLFSHTHEYASRYHKPLPENKRTWCVVVGR